MPRRPPAEAGYPRAARLTRRNDIDRVFQQGRKVVDRAVVAFFLPSPPDASRWRLGLSVSRKVGGSPQRNRCKRVLREAFRQAVLPPPAHDLVLVARAGTAPASLEQARAAVDRVLERALRAGPRREPRA